MAFPQGIYFRSTDNQTDPTDYDCEASALADYPWTTAQGNTVGWETAIGASRANRDTATDVRLKGVNFTANSGSAKDFRIDLPSAGSYNIRLAAGDKAAAQTNRIQVLDTTTSLIDVSGATSANHWIDATGVDLTGETDWATNNAASAQTFSTTICRMRLGAHASASGNACIAAFYIEAAAGGGGALSGSSAATSGTTGTLTGTGALSGTSAATSGATGTLANGAAGSLSGASSATSGATATLTAIGALIGSSAIVSNATGTLIDAIGHLSGTVSATSGATGTLRDGNPNNIWQAVSAASGTWTPTSGASGTWTPV